MSSGGIVARSLILRKPFHCTDYPSLPPSLDRRKVKHQATEAAA